MDRPAGLNSVLELVLFLAVVELEVCVFVLFETAWPCTDSEGIPSTVSGVTDTQALLALHVLDLTATVLAFCSILPSPFLRTLRPWITLVDDDSIFLLAIWHLEAEMPLANLKAHLIILVVRPTLRQELMIVALGRNNPLTTFLGLRAEHFQAIKIQEHKLKMCQLKIAENSSMNRHNDTIEISAENNSINIAQIFICFFKCQTGKC